MAYILTQQDIDRFNLADAIAGDVATEQELRLMFPAQMNERDQAARRESLAGMFTPAGVSGTAIPDATPEAQQSPAYMNEYSALRDLGLDVGQTNDVLAMLGGDETAPVTVDQSDTSQYQPTFSEMSLAERGIDEGAVPGALQSLLDQPSKSPADADGLTKNQRMVLAFAAIKDAGMALQGKEGGAFLGAMRGFREEADMERKREAALKRQELLGQIMGQGAVGMDQAPTPDAIRAQIDQLTNLGLMNPSLAPAIANKIKVLQGEAERLTKQETQTVAQMSGLAAVDALLTAPNLGAITGFEGTVNEFFSQYGMAPEFSNLKSYINQLQGLNFLEAYQQLKGGGPITDIEGKQATQARTRLEDSLKGRPEDLRVALLEVRELFQQALDKNPMYSGAGDYSEAEKAALEAARKARGI